MLEEVYLISGNWTPILRSLAKPENGFKEICPNNVQFIDKGGRKLVWFKSLQIGLDPAKVPADRLSHIYMMGGLPFDLGWGASMLGDISPEEKQLAWMYRRCAQFGVSLNARYRLLHTPKYDMRRGC
jgi:hypothetical protein